MRTRIEKIECKKGISYKAIYEYYLDGKRKRPSKTFKRKKDAENFLREITLKYRDNIEIIDKEKKILNDLIYEVHKIHFTKIKESTAKRYISFSKKILLYFNNYKLKDITANKIEHFYSNIINSTYNRINSNPYSEVEKIHKYLHLILEYAVKWGYINNNPLILVSIPKKKKVEIECWNKFEVEIFLNSIKDDLLYYNIFYFALGTGCRIGEICGLRWENIDFDNNIIKIREQLNQKKEIVTLKSTSSRRDIPMTSDIKNLLLKLFYVNKNQFVFTTENGQPFNPTSLSKSFSCRVEKINGLKKITFHGLRHTFVTICVTEKNIPLEVISKIVGHAKVSITSDIYFHLKNNYILDTFKTIDSII